MVTLHSPHRLATSALLVALAACGSDNTGGSTNPTIQRAATSGDAQSGVAGTALPAPLRVLVVQDGSPKSGVTVTWTAGAGSGSLAPATAQTGSDGIATTTWTLGPAAGAQTAQAAVAGAQGSPLTFTATAAGGGSGNVVQVSNNVFTPQTMTVPAGTTVTWQWDQNATPHNVISTGSPSFQSSPTRSGAFTYSVTFTTPGTYKYYCSVHALPTDPVSPGIMTGTITVQ